MDKERQRLLWTHRNRTRPDRCRSAAAVVARFAGALASQGRTSLRTVAEALRAVVDEEFRGACRVGALSGSTLWIHVAPSMSAAWIRMRWQGVLPALLRERLKTPRVERVAFRVSTDGEPLGDEDGPARERVGDGLRSGPRFDPRAFGGQGDSPGPCQRII